MSDSIEDCRRFINEAKSIVVLTGAGISTTAGIPDFRGPKGLYVTKQYDADKIFDINAFQLDPQPFYEFARDFVQLEETIQPTKTHRFLCELEKAGKLKGIITQNIDALHQKAGNKYVYEMHGSFWNSFCLNCHKEYSYAQMKPKILNEDIPECECGGIIKPDIVFFGENVKYYQQAVQLAHEADLFFVIGTSCVVQPAASVPHYTTGKIVVVNKGEVALNLPNIILTVDEDLDQFFSKVSEYAVN